MLFHLFINELSTVFGLENNHTFVSLKFKYKINEEIKVVIEKIYFYFEILIIYAYTKGVKQVKPCL